MLKTAHVHSAGTFTLSNLGMFGVDRFDAILPPGTVR
jgi:pyruvate dehydrogenase E2 component (dihydrolipoamide acetyltransferase)